MGVSVAAAKMSWEKSICVGAALFIVVALRKTVVRPQDTPERRPRKSPRIQRSLPAEVPARNAGTKKAVTMPAKATKSPAH